MQSLFTTNILAGELIQALCWTLIHSLWQGLLFTIVMGFVMVSTTRSSAAKRYNLISALFFMFLAVCACTFIYELNYFNTEANLQEYKGNTIIRVGGAPYYFKKFIDHATSQASLIVLLWFVIFCFKVVHMMTAFVYNSRVKSQKIIVATEWSDKVAALCEQLNIKRTVRLFESAIVKIPVVIGHIKPVIFIPVGLLTNLPRGEVEAVLLHELAHIRRNDFLVNMLQVIAETIFFFNPALLWMSNVLREERENCCDDVAVSFTKSKKQYIQALISFREHSLYTTNYTTAFPAGKNQLLKRVTRIVSNRNNTLDTAGRMFFLASFVSLGLLCIAATKLDDNVASPKWTRDNLPAPKLLHEETLPIREKKSIASGSRQETTIKTIVKRNDHLKPHVNDVPQASLAKYKTDVVEITEKTIVVDGPALAVSTQTQNERLSSYNLTVQQEAEHNRQQAEKDREQAMKDRAQAELERLQAAKDREQADKDRAQADRDREQAVKDRAQAMIDRKQAQKDREQAEEDRQRALKNTYYSPSTNTNIHTQKSSSAVM
jgi:bla regulator protein BlaR1